MVASSECTLRSSLFTPSQPASLFVRLVATDGYYPNQSNVLRILGYFSLVGLLRVHSLVGDYVTGLKVCC
jgi:translation initiation factor 3 subunit L